MKIKVPRPVLSLASPPRIRAAMPAARPGRMVVTDRGAIRGVCEPTCAVSAALPIAAQLDDLAGRIGRLLPDWRDPERYFQARSELQSDARRIVRELAR